MGIMVYSSFWVTSRIYIINRRALLFSVCISAEWVLVGFALPKQGLHHVQQGERF